MEQNAHTMVRLTGLFLLSVLLVLPVGAVFGVQGHLVTPEQDAVSSVEATTYTEGGITCMDGVYTYTRSYLFPYPIITHADSGDIQVDLPGSSHRYNPGEPMVPCQYVTVALDPWMGHVEVKVIPGERHAIPLDGTLQPFRHPVRVSDPEAEVDLYDLDGTPDGQLEYLDAYSTPGEFPGSYFWEENTFGLVQQESSDIGYAALSSDVRSNNADLSLYPVQYDHAESEIIWTESLTVTVRYSYNDEYPLPLEPLGDESYDMVVITSSDQVSTYRTLADYRNTTLISTRVVSLDNIYNEDIFSLPYCRDNQERIKYFIKAALENWGITYVLLGGDSGKVPYRTCYINDGADGTTTISDLYFADIYMSGGLFADWNADNDTMWAEIESGSSYDFAHTDLVPDLAIGRLPSQSASDAANMISKIENYEQNAYGDPFFNKVTLMGTDTFSGGGVAEGEYLCDTVSGESYPTSGGWSHTKLYQSLGNCNSAQYIANAGCGFLQFSDHGSKTGWAGRVNAGNVGSTTLGYKLPIVAVDACLCGAFDTNRCFAETFLSDANGGGIAAMAASRIGYGAVGPGHIQTCSGYMSRMYHLSYATGNAGHVGGMFKGAEIRFCNGQNEKSNVPSYKTIVEFCFFADPATYIGGLAKTDLTLKCKQTQNSVDPGRSVSIPFNVTNKGSETGKYVLDVSGALGPIPLGWDVNLTETQASLGSAQSRNFFLDVSPATGTEAYTKLELKVTLLSANIDNGPLTATTNVSVNMVSGMTINCTEPVIDTVMGSSVNFTLNCFNTGNYRDTVHLSTIAVPDGFDVLLSGTDVPMNMGQSVPIQVRVNVPPKALASNYTFLVDSYLLSDTETARRVSLFVNVLPEDGMVAVLEESTVEADPGQWMNFDVNVTNTGNHPDNILVSLSSMPTGWSSTIKPLDNVSLPAFGSFVVSVRVKAPSDALATSRDIGIMCRLLSTGKVMHLYATATVSEIYGMEVAFTEPALLLDTDMDRVESELELTNTGNIEDSYTVVCTPPGTDWDVAVGELGTLAPAAMVRASFLVVPPSGIPMGSYELPVVVRSGGGNITRSLNLTLTVAQRFGMTLELVDSVVSVDPGSSVDVRTVVTNTGNGIDRFSVSAEPQSGWTIITTNGEVSMGPGEKRNITISITPPATQPAGAVSMGVQGISTGDDSAADSRSLTVDVRKVFGLEIMALSPAGDAPLKVDAESSVDVKVRISSLANIADDVDIAVSPSWCHNLSAVELDAFGSKDVTLVLDVPGDVGGNINVTITVTSKGDTSTGANTSITLDVKKQASGSPLDVFPGGGSGASSKAGMYSIFGIILLIALMVVLMVVLAVVVTRRRKNARAREASPVGAGTREASPTTTAPTPPPQLSTGAVDPDRLPVPPPPPSTGAVDPDRLPVPPPQLSTGLPEQVDADLFDTGGPGEMEAPDEMAGDEDPDELVNWD